ncbi:pentapeptide repeat-containing protein [Micromonospora endolithica]|uniref:pentapeptide repeat-containing protein n=1 Tax=Micromonospora endolithica TaxID=230091 RepID=UPI001EE00F2B|nr:pentapeptide repeat-containing protein [Micromonospora endolithica]
MTRRWSDALTATGGLALVVVALTLVPRPWWTALASSGPVLTLVAVSLAALATGLLLRRRATPDHPASAAPTPPDRQVRPLPSWVIPAGVAVVAVVTWAAVAWLQRSVPTSGDGLQRAQLRVESIRTGLTIGAAAAGAFALLLAFRRQQLAERTQQATEYDAGEKRVTELYLQAADQLGSDKAPVRLAGLYALERLAQGNPIHRPSIVEVICAYLRMPYTPPGTRSTPADPAPATTGPDPTAVDPREERQVRLAAQRILARHLRPTTQNAAPDPSYWGPAVVLDLAEASLVNVDFTGCHLRNADFTSATFHGGARFQEATFHGAANFTFAAFVGGTISGDVMSLGDASFRGATFHDSAVFDYTTFHGVTDFDGAVFGGEAWFIELTCFNGARFSGATFHHRAVFAGGDFHHGTRFDQATFHGDADFGGVDFHHGVTFSLLYHNGIRFDGARFNGDAEFDGATLNGESYPAPPPAELAALAYPIEYARLLRAQGASLGTIATKTGIRETSLHRYLAEPTPTTRETEDQLTGGR